MPPLVYENGRAMSPRYEGGVLMKRVDETTLRGVFQPVFDKCPWASAAEVYKALRETDPRFDIPKTIEKLLKGRQLQLRESSPSIRRKEIVQPKQNGETGTQQMLRMFGIEDEVIPREETEKAQSEDVVMQDRKFERKPSLKRTSPPPDVLEEIQPPKKSRRNDPQKPSPTNSRATPITIPGESDEISSSSQQLPSLPQHPVNSTPKRLRSFKTGTDPIGPHAGSVLDGKPRRPHLFTNHSSPAKMNAFPPKVQPSPKTLQTSISTYWTKQQQPTPQTSSKSRTIQTKSKSRDSYLRPENIGPPEPLDEFDSSSSSSATPRELLPWNGTVPTSSLVDLEEEFCGIKPGTSRWDKDQKPRKPHIGREMLEIDNDAEQKSSPLPHKKKSQANRIAPAESVQSSRAITDVPPSSPPSPASWWKDDPYKSKFRGEKSNEKGSASNQVIEIPCSQPSPPPEPDLEIVEEALESRQGRPKRNPKPSRNSAQDSSELSQLSYLPSTPVRFKGGKNKPSSGMDKLEEEEEQEVREVPETSSSARKQNLRHIRKKEKGVVMIGRKSKALPPEKKTRKGSKQIHYVVVEMDEGGGEQEQETEDEVKEIEETQVDRIVEETEIEETEPEEERGGDDDDDEDDVKIIQVNKRGIDIDDDNEEEEEEEDEDEEEWKPEERKEKKPETRTAAEVIDRRKSKSDMGRGLADTIYLTRKYSS